MKASHKDAFPFVLLLLPYAAGILLCLYHPYNAFNNWPVWPLAVIAILFVLLNLLYKTLKVFKWPWLGGSLAIVFLLLSGVTITHQSVEIKRANHFSKVNAASFMVKVVTEPVVKNGNLRFTAQVEQAVEKNDNLLNVSGKLLITLSEEAADNLNYGDVLLIPATTYKPVTTPLNPAEFNYLGYLAHKNIYHQVYLSPGQFALVKTGAGNPLMAYAQKLRKRLVEKFKSGIKDQDAAAIASTLILGYNAELSNDILQAYSKTGTIHILSVSGAHVGLVYIVLVFLLAPLNKGKKGKLMVTLLIIACIWGYALLTGFSPPVCRAAMMLTFILLGRCFARRISPLNILAVSAFVSLLADPLLITDVGFQLSYLAVAGLIVLQPVIYQKLTFKNKLADQLWLVCSASIAAQLVTLPLSTFYFHQVPVYFLMSNLVILIPSAMMMYGGILYLLIPQDWLPTKWLGLMVEKLILFTNKTLSVIEHAPWSTINRVWLSDAEFLIALIMVVLTSYCIYKPNRSLVVALGIVAFTLTGFKVWRHYENIHTDELVFFSLRNDAAILLRNGNRATLITDADTSGKTYSYSIKPYLDSCGIDDLHIKRFESADKKDDVIDFKGKRIWLVAPKNKVTARNNYDFIYIKGKVDMNEDLIDSITENQTVIIAGKGSSYYKQSLVTSLKQKHIKYMLSGSNKALIVASN